MSEKTVHFYVLGDGDPQLQSLIEKGLSELGLGSRMTSVEAGAETVLNTLNSEEIPIVIKPA